MIGYEDLTWTGDRLRYGRRTRRAGFLQTDNPLSLAGQQGGRHCAERPAGIGGEHQGQQQPRQPLGVCPRSRTRGDRACSWPRPAKSALIVWFPACSFPQEEILENEFPFAVGKRRSTDQACYRAVNRFETSLDFDELIERFAVETCKETWPAPSHKTPPKGDW
jgi:hypothetical protein